MYRFKSSRKIVNIFNYHQANIFAMKKFLSFLILSILCSSLVANVAPDEKKIDSVIKRVTVFKKGAQVSRTATTSIPIGNSYLKFTGISPNIDMRSIQIKGEGNFTILSVNHQLDYFELPEKTAKIKSLFSRKEKLNDQKSIDNALLQVLKEEESLILANKSIGGSQTGVQINELKATAEFYRTRLKEIKLERLKINKTITVQKDTLQQIDAQLRELNAKQGNYTSEIVVAINSKQTVTGTFALSYIVKNAGWFPNYDIRVKDVQNPINLSYKGNVYQTSGESWDNVKLTLSTGDFSQTGTKPTLLPWKLQFYIPPSYGYRNQNDFEKYETGVYSGTGGQGNRVSGIITDQYGEPLIGANILVNGSTTGTTTDIDGKYSLELPPNARSIIVSYIGFNQVETAINSSVMNIVMEEGMLLDEVVIVGSRELRKRKSKKNKNRKDKAMMAATPPTVVKKERTTTTEFEIELPYTIPSDGKQYTVQMKDHELPAYYEYYCAPKIDLDAFLTARITGWEELNLLSGEANLFFEGTYLGKSLLNVESVEDTLDISLGRDQNIVVTRTKEKEYTKKQFIGNKKTATRSWDIEIRNKKKQSINIIVEDQYPISTTSEIEVKLESHKKADVDKDTGLLKWKFNLASNSSEKMNFKYSVKYPKRKRVVLE